LLHTRSGIIALSVLLSRNVAFASVSWPLCSRCPLIAARSMFQDADVQIHNVEGWFP
jgi:hypothetical protein